MRRLRKVPGACAALMLSILAMGCDMPWLAGGSGTETSNGELVAGRVSNGNGGWAVGASVYVRPSGYLKDTLEIDSREAPSLPDAVTDKDGYFRIKSLPLGSYKAEIRDGKGKALLLDFDLHSQDTSIELEPDTLRPVGVLQGLARRAPGMIGPSYVQVYGLDRLARTDDSGFFVIGDLPSGQIRFRVLSTTPGTSYPAPALAVIAPGGSVTAEPLEPVTFANEDYTGWPFSRRVYINTSAAGIADTVFDFPLLVRLDAAHFDFDLSDGKDVRFSGPGGRHLHYQLDSWDAAGRTAAFWVKLDTVLGKSSDQFITLHFGKRDAPDFSYGRSVFSGFGGAWHFSEAVDADGEGAFADASPAGSAAMAQVHAPDRQGVIGNGAAFRGTHKVVAPAEQASQRPARNLTVSAWVRVQGMGAEGGEFLSMGDNYGIRTLTNGNARFFVSNDTTVDGPAWKETNEFRNVQSANRDLRDAWHHVTGRYDGTTMKVFVDGAELASVAHAMDIQYPFHREFWMGQHGNGHNPAYVFTGSLDEVQMSPVARSASWIKLSYLTQQPGSTLLEFR